jgi:hypothetical protein
MSKAPWSRRLLHARSCHSIFPVTVPLRFSLWLMLLLCVGAPARVHGQPGSTIELPPPPPPAPRLDAAPLLTAGATEWMATFGTGHSVVLFHSESGYKYVTQTLSWGRVLTGPTFRGPLRGRFEWAIELMPMYGQYTPERTFGVGILPLSWRWNFEPRGRFAPFVELSAGFMKSNQPVPTGTARGNFIAHGGGGARILVSRQQAVVLAYRLDHISNGNQIPDNPAINAHAFHIGWSVLVPRK